MQESYSKALFYYEKGIEVQPSISTNYYRAAQIYLNITEEIWSMIYGETFMKIERNSHRTKENGKMFLTNIKVKLNQPPTRLSQ